MLKRENEKLWHQTKRLRTGEGSIGTSITIIPESVQVSNFQIETRVKRETREGKIMNPWLWPRILQWQDSSIEVYEDFRGNYCNSSSLSVPFSTAPAPQGQVSPQHTHTSQLHLWAALLPWQRQILCLESVASAVRPALWVHLTSACLHWRAPRLLSAASPQRSNRQLKPFILLKGFQENKHFKTFTFWTTYSRQSLNRKHYLTPQSYPSTVSSHPISGQKTN